VESIELLRDNLENSARHVLARVEDMREHAVVFPTPEGGAHTLWVLGHLAYVEGLVVREFILDEPNPLAAWKGVFDGDETSGDPARFPPFDEALARCREMRRATLSLLDGYTEGDLDAPSARAPEGFDDIFGTRRRCLQFVADHWLMHRGQLADARRAAGLRRMWL